MSWKTYRPGRTSRSGGGLLPIPDEVRVQLADGSVVWAAVR